MSYDGGDFDSAEKDSFLSLELDVLGPSDKPCEVSLWLDSVSNSIVSRSLFEEGISSLFDFFTSSSLGFLSFSLRLA